eukprot:PhF_6_TR10818/c0_g1_i1/m.17438
MESVASTLSQTFQSDSLQKLLTTAVGNTFLRNAVEPLVIQKQTVPVHSQPTTESVPDQPSHQPTQPPATPADAPRVPETQSETVPPHQPQSTEQPVQPQPQQEAVQQPQPQPQPHPHQETVQQ